LKEDEMTGTTRTETRHCTTCGAAFTARVVTGVVRCPECRKARREGTGRKATTVFGHTRVEHAGMTCTIGGGTAGRCGERAVTAFRTAEGQVFAECARHAPVAEGGRMG
jgi:ribosomal protein L37AE/L43A